MIYALLHNMPTMAKRASFPPLLELLDCKVLLYNCIWGFVQDRSWTLGHYLRSWGFRHYGSSWNWFVPYFHEFVLSCQAHAGQGDIVHFMMGEFGSPRYPTWFSRRGARLVGTFHCSARRLETVLEFYHSEFSFDRISVMSATQIPFFVARGYPVDRIDVTLHGVDTDYFRPGTVRPASEQKAPLRLLLVGSTERDHGFAAAVMKRLPKTCARLDVLTGVKNHHHYAGLDNVTILKNLSDEELMDAYRKADLLFMPVDDCTANNSVLESMACGTPVMVNRIGGMPEYVDAGCNYMLDEKNEDAWITQLEYLAGHRDELESRRPHVRAGAEKLDWRVVKSQYLRFYEAALAGKAINAADFNRG